MKSLRIVAATTAVTAAVAGTAGYGVALAQGGQERAQGASQQSPVTQAEMRRHQQVMGGMRHMHDQMMGDPNVRRHHREMMGNRDMRRLHDQMMGARMGRR
ncbi:MAG: hypothetical protein H0V15_05030 [Solirubrobacterales bacterium]|nr:hypothetical protein [Solirubrobacterales bacterium]